MQLNLNALKVLSVLYDNDRTDHYGLSISKETKLGNGTLYPILDKLQDHGLISSEWETPDSGRRPRLFYKITGEGCKAYENEIRRFAPHAAKLLPS